MESSSRDVKDKHPSSKLTTKELARSMGLVRKPLLASSRPVSKPKTCQQFAYVIVIDYEATCWKEKKLNYAPEIIEFPAVLLNTSTGSVESEFHMYTQPSEQPRLSGFCTELTGITQAQVDSGVPIGTCLVMFSRWLKELKQERGIQFPCEHTQSKENLSLMKRCTFVTWSDWDFGVCLKNECHRKQLRFPQPLRSWIDLRATYKSFYSRKPQGLAGALQDVGIQFSGRQHSGLDDARNTAKLAWRMIRDGCVLRETKALDGPIKSLWDFARIGQTMNSTRNEKHTDTGNEYITRTVFKSTEREGSERGGKLLKAGSSCQIVADPQTSTGTKADITVTKDCVKGLGNKGRASSDELGGPKANCTRILKRKLANESNGSLIFPKVSVLESNGSFLKTNSTSITSSLVMPVACLSTLRNTTGDDQVCQSLISESVMSNEQPSALCWKTGRQTVKQSKNTIRDTSVSEHVTPDLRDDADVTSNVANLATRICKSGYTRSHMSRYQADSESNRDTQVTKCNSVTTPLITPASRKLNTVTSTSLSGSKKKPVNRKLPSSLMTPKLDFSHPRGGNTQVSKSALKGGRLDVRHAWSSLEKNDLRTPLSCLSNGQNPSPVGIIKYKPAHSSGGKVTPPLCHCGHRSRRRSAVNPGPNQGRVFYTC